MSEYFHQEMPPKGGYPPIHIERLRSKRFVSHFRLFVFGVAISIYASYRNNHNKRLRILGNVEISNALIALSPFIEAERDRAYLKSLIALREEEAETMKKFPDWIPGLLFGLPRFKTLAPDLNPKIESREYFMFRPHRDRLDFIKPERHWV